MRLEYAGRTTVVLLAVLFAAGCMDTSNDTKGGYDPEETTTTLGNATFEWWLWDVPEMNSGVYVVGDIKNVLAGNLTEKDYVRKNLSDVMLSLGAGAVNGSNRTGEVFVVDGVAYLKPSDTSTAYALEFFNGSLETPFAFGLEKGELPYFIAYVFSYNNSGTTLDEVYERMSQYISRTFLVYGVGEFSEMQTTALKKPPLYGEPISSPENTNEYFHPVGNRSNIVGIFFGAVNNDVKPAEFNYDLSLEDRIFYRNYADKSCAVVRSHTHVLVTNATTFDEMDFVSLGQLINTTRYFRVEDVGHLLTQSRVKVAVIGFYRISNVTVYGG